MVQYLFGVGCTTGTILLGRAMWLLSEIEGAGPIDQWRAINELGLAVVIAGVSFFALIWWFKVNATNQREDMKRMAERIQVLEVFQQTTLTELTKGATTIAARSAEATEANTEQLGKLTDALIGMQGRLAFRPCFALDNMDDERRQQVARMIRESLRDASHGVLKDG